MTLSPESPEFKTIPWWTSREGARNDFEIYFLAALARQSPEQRSDGRAAWIEFGPLHGSEKAFGLQFSGAHGVEGLKDELENFLERGKSNESTDHRAVIILEDLGSNWVSLLARKLGVPMSVFACHWALPEDHTLGLVRMPLGQDARYHFILNYVQDHAVLIPNKNKDYTYRIRCRANRTIDFNVRSDTEKEYKQSSEQLISYWGIDIDNGSTGSWIALILVDPPLNYDDLLHSMSMSKRNSQPRQVNVFPSQATLPSLPLLSLPQLSSKYPSNLPAKPEGDVSRHSWGQCMFDDLILDLEDFSTSSPSSSTHRCRRLILARVTATLQETFSDVIRHSVASSVGVDEMSSFDFDTFNKAAWNSAWEGKKFTRLWEQRENLELLRYRLRQNIRTIRKINSSPLPLLSQNPHGKASTAQPFSKFLEQEQQDLSEWEELENMVEYINEVIVRTTDNYLQTVAAREAQVSNFQARSVSQLTRMATIFVPVSLCAAIFSMGGNFAAGDGLFWVFWAVSVPIAVLLITLMFTPIGTSLSKFLKNTKTKYKDVRTRIRKGKDVNEDDILEYKTSVTHTSPPGAMMMNPGAPVLHSSATPTSPPGAMMMNPGGAPVLHSSATVVSPPSDDDEP